MEGAPKTRLSAGGRLHARAARFESEAIDDPRQGAFPPHPFSIHCANRSRSTLFKSVESKYGAVHLSVVCRNQPADAAAWVFDAGGDFFFDLPSEARSRNSK